MQKTKFLVIAITTAAIIAAVTTTISFSAASPAFAKINCDETETLCSGGSSLRARGIDIPGGGGGHSTTDFAAGELIMSGGAGGNGGNGGVEVGGGGGHITCDLSAGCAISTFVGGSGTHFKGPGGNSDNAPP
jgi:hypothetical protein